MTLPAKASFNPGFPIADKAGAPTQSFRDYMVAMDRLVSLLAAGNLPPLVDAVNDAAAAAVGVGVGQIYRNGSTVMVRVV